MICLKGCPDLSIVLQDMTSMFIMLAENKRSIDLPKTKRAKIENQPGRSWRGGPATENDTQAGQVYFYLVGVMFLNIKKHRPNQTVLGLFMEGNMIQTVLASVIAPGDAKTNHVICLSPSIPQNCTSGGMVEAVRVTHAYLSKI